MQNRERILRDIQELEQFASQTGGRLRILESDPTHIRFALQCRTAVQRGEGRSSEIVVGEVENLIDLVIAPSYPLTPCIALHRAPEIFHPNVLSLPSAGVGLPYLLRGYICYATRHNPSTTLKTVVQQIHQTIAYVKWSASMNDCLCKPAVRWANEHCHLFPLEKRPLLSAS